MSKTKGGFFYGWLIVAISTLMMATMFTLMLTCMSLFVVPVTEDLGISRTAFAGISTIASILGMVLSPIAGKLLAKNNIRLLMTGSLVVCILSYTCFSFAQAAWHLYVCAFGVGAGFSFCMTVPMSILITRWFVKSRSLAMSITFAGSSIGAMLLSPVITAMIGAMGWRASFRTLGIVMLLVLVPLVFFIIRSSPEEKGLKPLGMAEAEATQGAAAQVGIPLGTLRKSPVFWVFVVGVVLALLTIGSLYHMPAHAVGIGFSAEQAALFVSIYSMIGIAGKLLMGSVFDKYGTKAGILLGTVSMALLFVFLLIARTFPVLLVAALFYGLGSALGTIFPATLTARLFGTKYFGETFGLVNAFSSLSMALNNPIMAASYDMTGSYTVAWIGGIVAAALAALFLLSSTRGSHKLMESELAAPLPQAVETSA